MCSVNPLAFDMVILAQVMIWQRNWEKKLQLNLTSHDIHNAAPNLLPFFSIFHSLLLFSLYVPAFSSYDTLLDRINWMPMPSTSVTVNDVSISSQFMAFSFDIPRNLMTGCTGACLFLWVYVVGDIVGLSFWIILSFLFQ